MEEKSAGFVEFLCAGADRPPLMIDNRAGALDLKQTDATTPLGCGGRLSIYNLVRVFD
jgi:hypothetical protein